MGVYAYSPLLKIFPISFRLLFESAIVPDIASGSNQLLSQLFAWRIIG